MLNALLHAKSGRQLVDGERIPWRRIFRESEDHITATIMERLSYLPASTALSVLFEASRGNDEMEARSLFGGEDLMHAELGEISFWPKWPHPSDTRRFVEPDVFLRLSFGRPRTHVHLIVEVKRGTLPQWAGQWVGQLSSHAGLLDEINEPPPDRIGLLALGGTASDIAGFRRDLERQEIPTFLAVAGWHDLARAVSLKHDVVSAPQNRILADMREALAAFGYSHVAFSHALRNFPRIDAGAVTKLARF